MRAVMGLWIVGALLFPGLAMAQQAPEVVASEPLSWTTSADIDEANRETLRALLARDEVHRAARIAGVEIDDALAAVHVMEGDRLANAAQQARVIEERLTSADDIISIRATTLIIVLLLIIIIIVVAG